MAIIKVLVVGAGQMGSGIAQVAAANGFAVTMSDVSAAQLERGLSSIRASVEKLRVKGRLSEAQAEAALHIAATTDLAAADVDLVIEAATEDQATKLGLFGKLDELAPPQAILASNTSSISITRLGEGTRRADKVIGMHFFNPVPVMQPVEVVRGEHTSDETVCTIVELSKQLGKTPVVVVDSPGFVSNRLLCPMLNEAILALDEGVADAKGIDAIMHLGMNHPMGPLRLADLIGLDTVLAIMNVLHRDLGDDKYQPAPLLRRMVAEGKLGRKSGEGFYRY